MKASLKNYRQSPRKVRLVAKSVRGKKVQEAVTILGFMPKRAALPLKKLIDSAVANSGMPKDELIVKNIEVNKGLVMKRIMPRARGSAYPINKRTSHVLVTLASKSVKKTEDIKAEVKEEAPKKVVKKTAVKKVAKKKTVVKEK
ncbi:MAG: 50S ribosomal protein L22 [Bacteroidetes bacterium]|nr:50S ribosomal protein L22 [Bacteroidota bacterium]